MSKDDLFSMHIELGLNKTPLNNKYILLAKLFKVLDGYNNNDLKEYMYLEELYTLF